MEDKYKFVKITHIVVVLLLLVSVGLNIYLLIKENQYKIIEKVKTEIVRDTVRDTIPEIRYEKVLYLKRDTLSLCDTIPGDTVHVVVEVPISQKTYSDDSTYTAWVSGYKQRLDSISVYRKSVYFTKEVTKIKKQKFIVGPYVGYGYDFGYKKAGPNIGIGLTYKLFGF